DRRVGERGERECGHHLEEGQLGLELAVDQLYVRQDFLIGLDESAGRDGLTRQYDPFGDRGQVRAGITPGAQSERIKNLFDHPRRGRLAVGPREVNRAVAALRFAEQVDERGNAFLRRVDASLAPPAGDLRLDLSEACHVLVRVDWR